MHVVLYLNDFHFHRATKKASTNKTNCNNSPAPGPWWIYQVLDQTIGPILRLGTLRHLLPQTSSAGQWHTLGKFKPSFPSTHFPSPVWSGVTSSNALRPSKPRNLLPPDALVHTNYRVLFKKNFFISASCGYFSEISTSTRFRILYSPCFLHLGYSAFYEADVCNVRMEGLGWYASARGVHHVIGLVSWWISGCVLHRTCACVFPNQTFCFCFCFCFQALEVAIYGVASVLQIRNQCRAQNTRISQEWKEI